MIRRLSVAASIAAAFAAGPAAAQFGPPALEANTPVLSELVVRAYGGPAWWKVADKDTTIYILGDPGPLPLGLTFDQKLLEKRLTGANTVILPPKVSLGLGAIFALPGMLGLVRDVNDSKKTALEPSLPPAVRARFVAQREKIGQPETRYGGLPTGLAGMALAGDVQNERRKAEAPAQSGPVSVTVADLVAQAAKKKSVRIEPSVTYGGTGMSLQFLRDIRKPGMDCLLSSLDEIERPPSARPSSADQLGWMQAWADGDSRPLIAAKRRGEGRVSFGANFVNGQKTVHLLADTPACMQGIPTVAKVGAGWIPAETAALTRAMQRPGHAVAVIEIGSLIVKDGVLDRLRKQGFTVTAPDGTE